MCYFGLAMLLCTANSMYGVEHLHSAQVLGEQKFLFCATRVYFHGTERMGVGRGFGERLYRPPVLPVFGLLNGWLAG